jgi:hypothetical protein
LVHVAAFMHCREWARALPVPGAEGGNRVL